MKIIPASGSRSILIGKTGTGKTTVALHLISKMKGYGQVQILATKEDDKLLSLPVPIVDKLAEVHLYKADQYPVVMYYPSGEELADLERLDAWCQWCYMRKNTIAFIDEVTQVSTSTKPGPGLLNLYTRGRSQNDTVLAGTQRPAGVPKILYTESENFFKFFLTDEKDRIRVAEISHPLMREQVRDMHGFHYYNPAKSNHLYYVSNLFGGKG